VRRPHDIAGVRFGRLVAMGPMSRISSRERLWVCRCDCGADAEVRAGALVAGRQVSCGCLQSERTAARNVAAARHGHASKDGASPEYKAWGGIKRRCYNPSDREFHNYGGRGITVCDRWRDSFDAFLADVGTRPSPRHSIDRIDNDRGYEPGNVRWATRETQERNKRTTRLCQVSVALIRCLSARRQANADLAWAFGVHPSLINKVVSRSTWKEFCL
jgi:hypothetical protein